VNQAIVNQAIPGEEKCLREAPRTVPSLLLKSAEFAPTMMQAEGCVQALLAGKMPDKTAF